MRTNRSRSGSPTIAVTTLDTQPTAAVRIEPTSASRLESVTVALVATILNKALPPQFVDQLKDI